MSDYIINGQPFRVTDGVERAYARRNDMLDAGVEHARAILKELPPVLAWAGCMAALQEAVPEDKREDPDVLKALGTVAAAVVRLAQQG